MFAQIIQYSFALFIGIFLAWLVVFGGSIIISWFNLQFYKKQGIPVIFDPLFGFTSSTSDRWAENKTEPYTHKPITSLDSAFTKE